jgi:Carboxypeptidase regulatory-like domain
MNTEGRSWMLHRFAACVILLAVLSVQCWPQGHALPEACRLSGHCINTVIELADPILVRYAEGNVQVSGAIPDQPMRGAIVEVFGPGDSTEKRSVETDARGRFRIKGLPAGNYTFDVWAPNFNSVTGRLTISKHAPRTSKLQIRMTVGA